MRMEETFAKVVQHLQTSGDRMAPPEAREGNFSEQKKSSATFKTMSQQGRGGKSALAKSESIKEGLHLLLRKRKSDRQERTASPLLEKQVVIPESQESDSEGGFWQKTPSPKVAHKKVPTELEQRRHEELALRVRALQRKKGVWVLSDDDAIRVKIQHKMLEGSGHTLQRMEMDKDWRGAHKWEGSVDRSDHIPWMKDIPGSRTCDKMHTRLKDLARYNSVPIKVVDHTREGGTGSIDPTTIWVEDNRLPRELTKDPDLARSVENAYRFVCWDPDTQQVARIESACDEYHRRFNIPKHVKDCMGV